MKIVYLLFFVLSAFSQEKLSSKQVQENLKRELKIKTDQRQNLEDWQKEVIQSEVLTTPESFLLHYTDQKIEIDEEGLNLFLRFYAPKILWRQKKEALLITESSSGCEACKRAEIDMKTYLEASLRRRGVDTVWMNPMELLQQESSLRGGKTEEFLKSKQIPIFMKASLQGQERVQKIILNFQIKEKEGWHTYDSQQTILQEEDPLDSIKRAKIRLYKNVGQRIQALGLDESKEGELKKIYFRLEGEFSFAQVSEFKGRILSLLTPSESFYESHQKKNYLEFTLTTTKILQDWLEILNEMRPFQNKVSLSQKAEDVIVMSEI